MKIIRQNDIVKIKGPVAVAIGAFDGIHRGHAEILRSAAQTGLTTAVATFSRHPSEYLKNRKAEMLTSAALKEKIFEDLGVDILYYLDFESIMGLSGEEFLSEYILKRLGATAVCCGFNFRFGHGRSCGTEELMEICRRYGAEGKIVPPVCEAGEPISSTRIRERIVKADMQAAERMLGRPFEFYLEVVHGRQLGRELGSPTINQNIPKGHIVPPFGVYASLTYVGGEALPSVTNVGVKPTVGSDRLSSETYILGYDRDLYGETIGVGLLEYLRPEKKFNSLEELKAQIGRDAGMAQKTAQRYFVRKEK